MSAASPTILIIGGGAGGLVLATLLGRRLGRRGRAQIVLVDCNLTHVWKPLLHELAAGTLAESEDALNYLSHAKEHHFRFLQGRMEGLDPVRREVRLAPLQAPDGRESLPARCVPYDQLVLAVGSVSNDFGVRGVREHCTFLDSAAEADRLQQRLLHDCLKAQMMGAPVASVDIRIAIVGAGATGVELAAELHKATRQLVAYGLDAIDPDRNVRVTLIEAAPRVLPPLPERLAEATAAELERLGIEVLTGQQVSEVTAAGIHTRQGRFVPAGIKVWCAGIKAPEFLGTLGLETNRIGQLVVDEHLRTSDPQVWALGDCVVYTPPGAERPIPPRAQAAHQQAYALAETLVRQFDGRPPASFVYRDYGSLISLSYSAVGQLMGNLFGTVNIEGWLARAAYVSLYRRHQLALHGLGWVILSMLARLFARGTRPRLKLH
ncbi:MAG TPA: NAD(P)/FAD-dependent oxidoreductase [Geminicoccaceae bacterium]|nr:NAD(P)/FAD-dependent oxidoreductase [Geminicoccaceae bacterium]